MEYPSATLVRFGDVVLGQQSGAACRKGSTVNPAFAGGDLLHRRHKDEIPRNQLKFVIILRGVRIDHLQGLQKGKAFIFHSTTGTGAKTSWDDNSSCLRAFKTSKHTSWLANLMSRENIAATQSQPSLTSMFWANFSSVDKWLAWK